jgi:uncharacterized protein
VTVYFDTSSLIKLYISESGSEAIHQLAHDADLSVTSALAYPEARATFARRRRERLMTAAETRAAIAALDADWPRFVVLLFGDDLALAAGRLADRHEIRGGDAVHLASFEALLSASEDEDIRFSCADDRLSKAARALGEG